MHARSTLAPLLRRLALAAALGAALASAFAAPPAAAAPPADEMRRVVKDPHYGDTLFYFFQERYFTSITRLMVSQHFERVAQHADEAEVLRGGMLLSYGLHREAGQIFAQLIDKGAAPPVRDRAWYYLAKIRYQRGFLAEAEDALARIGGKLPPELEEDRVLLHANLLLARDDYAGAAGVLDALKANASAGPYARYNLGVALVKAGDAAGGAKWLDELGRTPAASEELRSLRDKANVALGFAALQSEQPEQARVALERVRLAGLQSNKALLGFGWAAAAMKQPKQALVPWTELAARDPSDAAVLEARIAVPYALAELGAYGQSLARYEEAIAEFERESASLDDSIAAIRKGKLVDGLLALNPGDEMGWFWNIRELPEMPHAGHLSQVLAQHDFQEAFKNLRDLLFLDRNLRDWQDHLGVFRDMLDNRRQAYAERLPKVRGQAAGIDLASLQKRRDAVAEEFTKAETQSDGVAFADAKERDLLERLARVQQALQAAPRDASLDAARERARLAAGALTWQLAQQYPARVWSAKKELRAIDAALDEARRRDAALAQAQIDEPARHEKFAARIPPLEARVKALMPRVTALAREQQNAVQEIAVAELARQKERLAAYATQARFAVAQLYDRALVSRTGHDAAKP